MSRRQDGLDNVANAATLKFEGTRFRDTLVKAYQEARDNLLVTNTLVADEKKHNRTGLLAGAPPKFFRAGSHYQDPWTRDASVNAWNAGSLLCPQAARNTLWAVCERLPNGRLIIQKDCNWWDKLIWVTAAWNHFATTGDEAFLAAAYEATEESLNEMYATRFDREFGLFQGPSHLNDGVAGYPEPFVESPGSNSFILTHAGSETIMTLSSNAIACHAARCAARMANALRKAPEIAREWDRKADAVREAINRHLWLPKKGAYAYFMNGDAPHRGTVAEFQEATGVALAVHFGIADADRAARIVAQAKTTPFGTALVEPEIPRYSRENHISRHGRIIWPMAQGYWATATAATGNVALFQRETEALVGLAKGSDWDFCEIYSPADGKPNGGWQSGWEWNSCNHQTWSATAYLRMIHYGLFGMQFEPAGIRFAPTLPEDWGNATLSNLLYRGQPLEVALRGKGARVGQFRINGKVATEPLLPAVAQGPRRVEILLA